MQQINNSNEAPLQVREASAGSGKTFTLTVAYIKLLIENPENYRYILAVTFTNKATDEMKTRILSTLYALSRRLSEGDDYLHNLQAQLPGMNEGNIRKQAETALNNLLNNYHYFRVETIDSFFQRVLRGLARELNLTANLKVSLNDTEVEEQAVDNIIENIKSEKDPLLGWIMSFISQQMQDNKNWNVIDKIKDFSKLLSSEFYQNHADQLSALQTTDAFFDNYIKSLRGIIDKADKTMKSFAEEFKNLGLDDELFSRPLQNAPGYFRKLESGHEAYCADNVPNSYILKALSNPSSMVKKADIDKPYANTIIEDVGKLLNKAEQARQKCVFDVNTAIATQRNLNQLRLLKRISEEVNAINEQTNSYLLSGTQKLLSDMIEESDSPFIYEKIGGTIRYIMIDEFQDTSKVQWKNFKVLIDECISQYKGSLIVGDVKQSIYRWRSGDWKMLSNLTESQNPNINTETLDVNYRSEYNIVKFNNVFFHEASLLAEQSEKSNFNSTLSAGALNESTDDKVTRNFTDQRLHDISNIYNKVQQNVSEKHLKQRKGYVRVELLPQASYEEEMPQKVSEAVSQLLEKGVAMREIAVLVRTNRQIQYLARWFQDHEISVRGKATRIKMVSDEAFRLDASTAVMAMVYAMKVLVDSTDKISEEALRKIWFQIAGKGKEWPENFSLGKREQLLHLSLMDLAQQLHTDFRLNQLKGQTAYVCTFIDQLQQFVEERSADLSDFIKEWEDHLCGKSIQSADIDGIRMLTIHKSKGLEYAHIIFPYCDWEEEKWSSLLWVEPHEKPFNDLSIVPVNLQAKLLLKSHYREDYLKEHIMNVIDTLNLLYVGFTRAKSSLIVFGKYDRAQYTSKLVKNTLSELCNKKKEENPFGEDIHWLFEENTEEKRLVFELGALESQQVVQHEDIQQQTVNVFKPLETSVKVDFVSHKAISTFLQSNDSQRFVTPLSDKDKSDRLEYIKTGNVIHDLLARIYTIKDLPKAVEQLEYDGVLYGTKVSRENLLEDLKKKMKNKEVADWFSSKWTVINERSILIRNTVFGGLDERRPDRVITRPGATLVIDFKTGDEEHKHFTQVKEYVSLLRNMGYVNVKGKLWYIKTNKVVSVD